MSNYVDYDNAVELFTEVGNKRKASESMQESLLKSTVGWTGKNELKILLSRVKYLNGTGWTWSGNSVSRNGVTFTFATDSNDCVTEIDVDGTSSAQTDLTLWDERESADKFNAIKSRTMILSGCPSGASDKCKLNFWCADTGNKDDEGSGVSITFPDTIPSAYNFKIRVYNGKTLSHVKFYNMLRDASITDDTNEPYHESVEEEIEQIYADNGVLGAKNIADESNIEAGRAWNGDTNSARARWIIPIEDSYEYIASISGTNSTSYIGYITSPTVIPSAQSLITVSDFPVKVTPNSGDKYVIFGFNKTSITKSDVEALKFMLRLASDPDDTYVPHAMTNRELTEELTVQESAVTDIIEGATVGDLGNHLYKMGKLVWLMVRLNGVTTTAWADNTPIGMIPEGFRPRNGLRIFNSGNANALQPIQINSSGTILSAVNLSNQIVILTTTWITD